MKYLLQAEAIALFIVSVVLINLLPLQFPWWVWILLFLAPDLSMIGYAVNNKVGAYTYLLGHSALDRVFGYGLKLEQGFRFTHLGEIGHK